jgi:hypothetical protein
MVFQWILCGHVLQSNVSLLHALLHITQCWLSVLPLHFHLCFTKHLSISSQLDLCFTGFLIFIFLFECMGCGAEMETNQILQHSISDLSYYLRC